MRPDRFSWLIENELAGMAHPGLDPQSFAELKALGVEAVVSLTMEPLAESLLRRHGLAYLHLAIPNFAGPQPSQVDRFVAFCRENIDAGRPVAVHCLAGCGRTGTMLACYLVAQGQTPLGAIRTVRERRPCSIESEEQEDAVFEYGARLEARQQPARRGESP